MNGNETVTRLRGTETTNRNNDTVINWDDPDDEDITSCLFAPGGTSEDHDGRNAVIVNPTLYAPSGSDIAANDRLVVRGLTYDVDGEPGDWVAASGWQAGMVVPLKRVDG